VSTSDDVKVIIVNARGSRILALESPCFYYVLKNDIINQLFIERGAVIRITE
jgi:hypothetical protein